MITKTTAIPAKLQTIIDDAKRQGLDTEIRECGGDYLTMWSVTVERPRRPIANMLDLIEMSESIHLIAAKGVISGSRWSLTATRMRYIGKAERMTLKRVPFALKMLSDNF